MTVEVVNLFAGGGGWEVGLRRHDPDLASKSVSIEIAPHAVRTLAAAGFRTIRASVPEVPRRRFRQVAGLIASPPCQTFSMAGPGTGRSLTVELAAMLRDALSDVGDLALTAHRERIVEALTGDLEAQQADGEFVGDAHSVAAAAAAGAALSVEPARWIADLRPRWVALEQVPAVQPLWSEYAAGMRDLGYSVWTGVLNAADFGVPQTRRRAVLIASLDNPVTAPEPTHAQDPVPSLLGELEPWVPMAEALGWADDPATAPDGQWRRNDQSGPPADPLWPLHRPSTTVTTRDLVQDPGTTRNQANMAAAARAGERVPKTRNDGYRITVREGLVLQSFPEDHPLQGPVSAQFTQVGNAVPPAVAARVCAAALGHPAPPRACNL